MRIANQSTVTTVTVTISVDLASQEEARDFLSYVRSFGKSGVLVERDGRQVPVRNIEKTRTDVDNVRELILTIADEVDGVSFARIMANAKELGYTINKNTLSGAIHALKITGKLRVLSQSVNTRNRRVYIYQSIKSPRPAENAQ